MFKKVVFAIVFALASVSAAFAGDIPPLVGHVNDYANVLTKEQKLSLNKALTDAENNTIDKPQIVLLTVAKLPDIGIDQYANDVYREWKLGQKGKDNGVLLVLAPNDRKVRIEVGYGLEPSITDARSGQIIDSMKPFLRNKDYYAALRNATYELIKLLPTEPTSSVVLEKKSVSAMNAPAADNSEHSRVFAMIGVLGIGVFAFVAALMFNFHSRKQRERARAKSTEYYTPPKTYQPKPKPTYSSSRSYSQSKSGSGFSDGFVAGSIIGSASRSNESSSSSRRSRSWDDSSSSSSSSSYSGSSYDSSSSSSSSDSGYSGGGGDSGGGGSSDSW